MTRKLAPAITFALSHDERPRPIRSPRPGLVELRASAYNSVGLFPIYQQGAALPFIPSRTGRSADASSMAGKQLQGCERER